jgi:hypothetical protein
MSPSEMDVASKSCDYDSRTGYAGDIGESHYSVDYYYTLLADSTILGNKEILYKQQINVESTIPDNSIQSVIFQIELGIGSYLLNESGEFQSAPCHMRKLVPKQVDVIQNVGLTLGPDDAIIATCESDNSTVSCYWVAGSFQVYTMGSGTNTTVTKQNIHHDLQQAMNGGALNYVHRAILNITYMESLPSNNKPEKSNGNGDTTSSDQDDPDNDSAAIIVSSSVGAVLLVTAVAMVSRRRLNERTMFQANSSIDVSAVHTTSQEAPGADSSVL